MASKVVEIGQGDLQYGFDDGPSVPYVKIGPGSYGTTVRLDPVPGYTHDSAIIEETLAEIDEYLGIDTVVYNSQFNDLRNTNGWAQLAWDYYSKPEKTYEHTIWLSGKRTPINPLITPGLVAHEYGHHVEYHLNMHFAKAGSGSPEVDRTLMDAYRKLRDLPDDPRWYGPGSWHLKSTEMFANDWRIIVCKKDVDWWPHPTSPHPGEVEGLTEWWLDIIKSKPKHWVLPE